MTRSIAQVDPNLLRTPAINKGDILWLDATDSPISIHGLAVANGGKFWRLPENLIDSISDNIAALARYTAGGRIRFRTDSRYVAFRAKSFGGGHMFFMPLTGTTGTDLFVNGKASSMFRPCTERDQWFEGFFDISSEGMNDIELNLGLYNGYTELYIGIQAGALLEAPRPYAISKPIVYYGSSITQGACASKPGNTYESFLSRWLDADHINLGFYGNCKGEESIAEYIASLDMSAFVLDYDHNAPTLEYLDKTYFRFFEIVRKSHPDLPVIMVSMPDIDTKPEGADQRREIILKAYLTARKNGDQKIWFVDGRSLFQGRDRDCCTVDGCHPNDLGFYRMAESLYPVLKEALHC